MRLILTLALISAASINDNATPANWSKTNTHWVDMAASTDHAKALAFIKDGHIQPNLADEDGNTPLMMAAREGDFPAAQELIDRGADIRAWTDYHYDPLRCAIAGRNPEIVALLLTHGADPNDDFVDGDTALMNASQLGSLPMVSFLLARGAKVEARSHDGANALSNAAEAGHADVVAALIDHGANPNELSEQGMTPLQRAATAGKLSSVQMLVQKGADPNLQDSNYLMSPVECACRAPAPGTDYAGIVNFLLKSGAKPSLVDKNGQTPLMNAASSQNSEAIRALGAHGADLKSPTGEGVRALREALEQKHYPSLQALLQAGVDPNVRYDNDGAFLFDAVARQDLKAVQLLIAAKANVNIVRRQSIINSGPDGGQGAYIYSNLLNTAVDSGSVPIVKELIRAGANPMRKDGLGQTALDDARTRKNTEMVKALETNRTAK
jgi:ankyrin repeat protein